MSMQAEKDELPVLPEPCSEFYDEIDREVVKTFSAIQMHAYAREAVATATSKLAELQREVEELRVKARRYEFLRNECGMRDIYVWDQRGEKYQELGGELSGHHLDAAIDSALAAAPRIEGNATESKGMGGEQQQGVPMTEEQIDLIAADGMRNAAGGIYATSVYDFARAIEQFHGIAPPGIKQQASDEGGGG